MNNLRSLLSGAWAVLALWYLFGLMPDLAGRILVFGCAGLFMAAWVAAMVFTRHPWSVWMISGVMIFVALLTMIVAPVHTLVAALSLILGVATLVFVWNKTSQAELRPAGDLLHDAKSFVGILLGTVIFTTICGFVVVEGENVQMAIKKTRLESQCTDPKVDIEACKILGIAQVNSPVDEKEMQAGQDLLTAMCKDGNPIGCRRSLFGRMTWQFDKMTYRDLRQQLWTRCQAEGGTACLALTLDDYIQPEALAEVAKSKCSKSDLDACVAWATATNDDQNEAHTKSCSFGIEGSCVFSGVPVNVREKACARSKNPWTCFAATESTKYCDQGVWPACDPAAWPMNRWKQIDWAKRLAIRPAVLTPAWEKLEAGREQIRKTHNVWRPVPMALADIDATFGAACDSRIAYGCIEAANAASNVQLEFRTQERIAHAQKSLSKGCEMGDYLACSFLLSTGKLSQEKTMEYARNACYFAPRGVREYPVICATYVHLRMAEVGFTPWLMDSTLAEPDIIDTCAEQKDRYVCEVIPDHTLYNLSTPEPTKMPQHVLAWDAASVACMQYIGAGCEELVRLARAWPVQPEESPQQVAQKVCKKIPEFCDVVNQALP